MRAPILAVPASSPSVVERFSNGMLAVVVDRPASNQVLASLMVRVGSRYEAAAVSGVSHFLEHVLFRGNSATPDSHALTLAFEQVGGMLNAVTGVEATEFFLIAHPQRLDLALDRLARFVREPTFADVEKERQIILDEMLYDYNDKGELIDLATLSAQLLWPDHPLSQPIPGTPEIVGRLGEADLRAHHRGCYLPGNCILALVGNVRPEEGLRLAAKHFGGWATGPDALARRAPALDEAPRSSPGPVLKLVADADNQFHVQLSFPGPGYNAPEDLALTLLSRVLDDGPASLLQRVVREERALVYGISAGYAAYCDAGQFDISTSVKAERLEELLECVLGVLAGFRKEGPSREEVERARQRHRFDLEFGQDSLSAWAERYAWPLLYSTVREEQAEREAIERITVEDLHALANRLFAPERLHLALVGPRDGDTQTLLERAIARFSA
jgi:predicted Zn-dependent peptidase